MSDWLESSSEAEAVLTAVDVFADTTAEIWSTPVFTCAMAPDCVSDASEMFFTSALIWFDFSTISFRLLAVCYECSYLVRLFNYLIQALSSLLSYLRALCNGCGGVLDKVCGLSCSLSRT